MNIKKLKKAAQIYGTPLYVYDLSVIDRQLKKLKVAFNKINNYQIHFAAKALSNISILKYINSLGLGLDAVSIEEVKIGIKCGFKKEEILFTPNGVNFSEIKEAVLGDTRTEHYLKGSSPKRWVIIQNKIINIVH